MRKYRALKRLVDTRTGVSYAPGDPIHLTDEVARVLRGRIEAWDGPETFAGVDEVSGIGPERARALGRIGITTLRQLAGADADAVERKIPALTVEQIKRWQQQATQILEQETKHNG